jgi:hypothetical protein
MTAELLIHPAEFWAATDTLKRIQKRKLCLAAGRGDCEGKIVEAHTIPRSQLQKIAVNGHVYHMRATPADILANNGLLAVGERGVGDFSVLNFFCAQHDRQLFSCIENDELIFNHHQLALLHYRAMGAELYKKMNGLEGARHQTHLLQNRKHKGGREKYELAKAYERGSELGLRDMTRTFSICESILQTEDYRRINGLVLRFKKMPTIMTVGGFSPEFDYEGGRLQKLGDANATYEQIGLSILAAEDRAAAIFTWIRGATVSLEFAQSLIRQDSRLFTTLAIQTAFEHLENTCMNIPWWDALRSIEREKLLERMQFAGSPFEGRTNTCLQFCGINFGQWDSDGFTVICGN